MLIAELLGVWILVSIIVTPLIGLFLFVMTSRGQAPKRSDADIRPRNLGGDYLQPRRQRSPRREGFIKLQRHWPRAG